MGNGGGGGINEYVREEERFDLESGKGFATQKNNMRKGTEAGKWGDAKELGSNMLWLDQRFSHSQEEEWPERWAGMLLVFMGQDK